MRFFATYEKAILFCLQKHGSESYLCTTVSRLKTRVKFRAFILY
jgi:hypothetical protein